MRAACLKQFRTAESNPPLVANQRAAAATGCSARTGVSAGVLPRSPASSLSTKRSHIASATKRADAWSTSLSSGVRSLTAWTISSTPSPDSSSFPSSPSPSKDLYEPSAGLSCSRTCFTIAATCGLSVPGTSPVASAPRSKPAIASGSSSASPESTTAASRPKVPCARSAREMAKSSSSRLSFGAAASRTWLGVARQGVGAPPVLDGTSIGPGTSAGFGNDGSSKGRKPGSRGGCGSCANSRPPPFLTACLSKISAAPIASFSSTLRNDSARGERRYRRPVEREMESSGMVSRSTNTPSPASLATTPIALLSITAKRRPCRMLPPPWVDA